jgi:serine protease Do
MTLSPRLIAQRTIPSVALITTPQGHGTGFVVRADGRIATNHHVIEGAPEATVTIGDKEYRDVRVVASDAKHDLAVLAIDARDLPVLTLGDSNEVHPGQEVVAIGHPLGLGNTISDGLVSGVRNLGPELRLLQVSAPISSGSSGGPLLDEQGRVIGISTLVVTKGQNLNFGVPVNYLKDLMSRPETPMSLAELSEHFEQPKVLEREVPNHDVSMLDDIPAEDAAMVEREIARAIGIGAPLYNDGHHEACFRIYQGTALRLDRQLTGSARKLAAALMDGVLRAEDLPDETSKAWAMRDAFDGVLDVIDRNISPRTKLERKVPQHELSLLKGCSDEHLRLIANAIGEAIEVGAPLYNQGHSEACFRIYQGTAFELIQRMKECPGPTKALQDGIARAAAAESDDAKAWAMRDTFDGLLLVIEKRSLN